jgi:hypothetical protein
VTANLNNPAGRLYALLEEYKVLASQGKAVRDTWAEILDVEPSRALTELARTMRVVTDLQRAVERHGDEAQQAVFDHWIAKWVAPFFAPKGKWDSRPGPGPGLVDREGLIALGALSSFLSMVAPEAHSIPSEDTLAELRKSTRDAIDILTKDTVLRRGVRLALAEHLQDLDEALTYLRIGGPKDVAAALKRLRCQALEESDEVQKSPTTWRTVEGLFVKVWAAFALGGPATNAALEAWMNVGRQLGG